MHTIHFSSLDLNLLRVFDALMEERSVTRAGARLGLTQSAISHALNRLRYELDDALFVRGTDGMQPTPRAAEIGPRLRQALHQVQRALEPDHFDPATTDRGFTIGATDYVSASLMPELVARLREAAPHAELRIRPLDDIDLVEELDAGRIDLVISSFRRVPERFVCETLYQDELVWALRADHPAAVGPLTLEQAAKLPHLAVALAGRIGDTVDGFVLQHGLERRVLASYRGDLDRLLADRGLSRHSPVTVSHFLAVPRMLVRTDLVALLPRCLATRFAEIYPLKVFELPPDCATFEIMALWHQRLGERADIIWLRSLLRDAAAAVDPSAHACGARPPREQSAKPVGAQAPSRLRLSARA